MKKVNFNSNQFSYLSNEVKLAMDIANQMLLNHRPDSFGTDQKIISETETVRNFVADSLGIKANEVFFGNGRLNSEIEIINNAILFLGVENIITSKFENIQKLDYLKKLHFAAKIKLIFIETSEFGEINQSELKKELEQIQTK